MTTRSCAALYDSRKEQAFGPWFPSTYAVDRFLAWCDSDEGHAKMAAMLSCASWDDVNSAGRDLHQWDQDELEALQEAWEASERKL